MYRFREGGFRGLLRRALVYMREALWSDSEWRIYERELTDDVSCVRATVIRRELGFRELVDLGYFKARDFPEAMRRRMDSGNVCYGFFEGGQLATIGWSSVDYLELDANLRISCPSSVGLFDFYTKREFRSKGYYTNALRQLVVVMSDAGFVKARIAVDPNNTPSIKGIERAGFRLVMRVSRRRRLGRSSIRQECVSKHASSVGEKGFARRHSMGRRG